MKKLTSFFLAVVVLSTAACKKGSTDNKALVIKPNDAAHAMGKPPKTWKEHWFQHTEDLKNVYYDDHVAVYYDKDMDTTITWPGKEFSDIWAYVKKTYGEYGDSSRLYVVLHANKFGGGHPSPYYDASHDYRNVLDVGYDRAQWYTEDKDRLALPIHEIGHIVASSSYGMTHDLNDYTIWGDSKFAEIFVYDVLLNTGHYKEANEVYVEMNTRAPYNNIDYLRVSYPGVDFFVDWFYPIYTQYGRSAVLARYFNQLAKNLPMDRSESLNLGEFVHFYSGAAGVNLREQAKVAFKAYWTKDVEAQFRKAQQEFPNVRYAY